MKFTTAPKRRVFHGKKSRRRFLQRLTGSKSGSEHHLWPTQLPWRPARDVMVSELDRREKRGW